MKYIVNLLIIILGILFSYNVCNAEIVTSYGWKGDMVQLDLGWTGKNYGSIQWQQTTDNGATWVNVENDNPQFLKFRLGRESLYRAIIKGDPNCPDIIKERRIVPISFSSEIVSSSFDRVTMQLSELSIADADVVEVGFVAGLADMDRAYTLLPRNKVADNVNLVDDKCTYDCINLQPNTAYNIRAYVKTADGSIVFGPKLAAKTTHGIYWSTEDWTISKNALAPRIKVSDNSVTNLKLYYGKAGSELKESALSKSADGSYYRSLNRLTAGTEYNFKVTADVNGKTIEIFKSIRTISDYSKVEVDETVKPASHTVIWDNNNLRTITPSGMQVEYPRMCRVDDQKILFTYHGGESNHWKNSYLRKSYDNGKTWSEPIVMFDAYKPFYGSGFWRICNPEMTKLQHGWIIMSVVANANPESNKNCKVLLTISKDGGETWSDPVIVGRGRTWEPQIIQMPNGELELLVSSEADWWNEDTSGWIDPNRQEQRIVASRSTDFGETWSTFESASYLPGCRDGMPVSVVMQGNKGVMFIIESVGSGLPPTLVHRKLDSEFDDTNWDRINDSYRWTTSLAGGGGAPYMIQLPTGEFLVMAHTDQTGSVWQTCRPQVMVADNTGHNFRYSTKPLPTSVIPSGTGCYYNSFFLFDDNTVWMLVTKAKYFGSTRDNSEIIVMEGKIVER